MIVSILDLIFFFFFFFFQAEDGIRDRSVSRGLGDVYKRQDYSGIFNGGVRWNRIFKDANPDK